MQRQLLKKFGNMPQPTGEPNTLNAPKIHTGANESSPVGCGISLFP